MTDVPFYAFGMLSALFFIRGIRRRTVPDVAVGTVFACAAALTRQCGVFIPVGFALGFVAKNGLTRRNLLWAGMPLLVTLCCYLGYDTVLGMTAGFPAVYHKRNLQLVERISRPSLEMVRLYFAWVEAIALNIGLFVLPVLVVILPRQLASTRRRGRVVFLSVLCGLTGLWTVTLLWRHKLMPILLNILYNIGIGPPPLRDIYVLHLHHLPTAPVSFWVVTTVVTVFGTVLMFLCGLLVLLHLRRPQRDASDDVRYRRGLFLFALSFCVLYVSALALIGAHDRYVMFFLPLVSIIVSLRSGVALRTHRGALCVACGMLVLLGLFTVAGTHDYFSWNRARWQALNHLTQVERVPAERIDGGFEFNGWYLYDPQYTQSPGKSWWWVKDDEYVVAFGPIPGYEIQRTYPYRRWLPPGEGQILILHRDLPK